MRRSIAVERQEPLAQRPTIAFPHPIHLKSKVFILRLADRDTWDAATGHLPAHEDDHVAIFVSGASELAAAIPATASSEKQLDARERANFRRVVAIIQARSDKLDEVTDGGLKPK
jgi:hypothetical protein